MGASTYRHIIWIMKIHTNKRKYKLKQNYLLMFMIDNNIKKEPKISSWKKWSHSLKSGYLARFEKVHMTIEQKQTIIFE